MTRDDMIKLLEAGECTVTFTKIDKSIRVMPCTLNTSLIPPAPPITETKAPTKEPRKVNESVIPVFCLDKKEWRSFRVDSVISII